LEVSPLVIVGLMWVVLNALRKGGSRPTGGSGTPPSRAGSRPPTGARPADIPSRLPAEGPPLDATQREGSQLEQLLRGLGRTLDQAGQQGKPPTGRTLPPSRPPTPARLPKAMKPATPASKGESPASTEGQSLELGPARGARAVEDLDDEAERVVQVRMAAAEANLRPLSETDHRVFEERIRQEPTDKTAVRGYTSKQLRDAVVWREILGPPVSLRGDLPGEW
jgi:hypothetical protein